MAPPAASQPRLCIAPRHLALLVLPMAVVALSEALLSAFADTDVLGPASLAADAELRELSARYRFLSIFLFYVATALVITAIFIADLLSHHVRRSCLLAAAGFAALIAFAQIYTSLEPDWMGSFNAYELLGAEVFRAGLARAEMPFCAGGGCGPEGGYAAFRLMMAVINLLAALAVAALILGMISSLARPAPPDLSTSQGLLTEAATLQEAQRTMRRYLYLSGVLLSVGMMFGYGWMLWPAELLADPGQQADYRDLVQAISLYRGVSYTVLILSFYMPVSLLQMMRIERLHMAADAAGLPEIRSRVQGFDIDRIGSLDAFKAILSILAPILASALGSFTGIDALG